MMNRISYILSLTIAASLQADPPGPPPNPLVELGPVFCYRVTDIEFDEEDADQDKIRLEVMLVNWTNVPAAGIVMSLNRADYGDDVPADAPVFSNAFIDTNGRPIGDGENRPSGNLDIDNHWEVVHLSSTSICLFGPPAHEVPPAFATINRGTKNEKTFEGLLDPQFCNATQEETIDALLQMIPGSVNLGGEPPFIGAPDPETIDNGPNVLDGFVFEIDDWDIGERLSINWHLLDAAGNVIGIVSGDGAVDGDAYGFGVANKTRFDGQPAEPPFIGNTGYDPPDDLDSNQDRPLFWAEDQDIFGVDLYRINPIPAGKFKQGEYFAIEPAAAVTAAFLNPSDNQFMFEEKPVVSGINFKPTRSLRRARAR